MMKFILLLLASSLNAQVLITDFCGTNSTADPTVIGECEAQSSSNVEPSRSGFGLKKRDGFQTAVNMSPTATSLTSAFIFKTQSGVEIVLAADQAGNVRRSANFASSTALSTITAGARLYCEDNDGTAYCFTSSNDAPFSYDGTTYTPEQLAGDGYVNGKFNLFIQDRHLVAGTTDFLNRLYISKSGDWDEFNLGLDEVDAWTEDIGRNGDRITGLLYLNGRVVVFKEFSMGAFSPIDTQFSSVYYNISESVGISDPEAIAIHNGIAYLKASDNNFYAIDGNPGMIERISGKIKPDVANFLSGLNRQIILTTKADFDGGSTIIGGPGAPTSTTLIPGSVLSSSVTLVDISSSDFSLGTLSNVSITDTIDSVKLSSSVLQDDFSDGDYTANPLWTVVTGGYSISSGRLQATGSNVSSWIKNQDVSFSSGSWVWTHETDFAGTSSCYGGAGSVCFEFRFVKHTDGSYYALALRNTVNPSNGHGYIDLFYNDGTTETMLTRDEIGLVGGFMDYAEDVEHDWKVTRSSAGAMFVFMDGVFITSAVHTSIHTSTMVEIGAFYNGTGDTIDNYIDNFYAYSHHGNGDIISQIFDTNFSTPTPGILSSTFTALPGAEGNVAFYTRSSLVGDDTGWSSWVSSSDTLNLTGLNEQFWQYKAEFNTTIASKTPTLDDIGLLASTTGQYETSCIEIGAGISAFGTLEASGQLTGVVGLGFEDRVGADCDNLGSYSGASTGTTITQSASAAYQVRVTFEFASATETARMDSLTVAWSEGSVPPASSVVEWDNSIYIAVSSVTGSNNQVFRYIPSQGSLWPFSLKTNQMLRYKDKLYMTSTTDGSLYQYSAQSRDTAPTSDAGVSIIANWRSKLFSGGNPFVQSIFQRVSILARDEDGGDVNVKWRLDGGDTASGNYDVSLSTGTGPVRFNFAMPVGQRGQFFDLEFSDDSTEPFEILGIKLDGKQLPWRVIP